MKRIISLTAVFVIFAGCIKDRYSGADLRVGDSLPDFEVVMNDGTVISDDILKETVSVVMFFHTTCPDCQQALPQMQKIYDEYRTENVLFALISREDNNSDVETYWRKNAFNMPYSAQDSRDVYEKFAQIGIPRVYINEKGGIIRYMFTDDPTPSYFDIKSALDSIIR